MRVRALANGAEQFMSVGVTLITWASPDSCPAPVLTYNPHPKSSQFGKPRPQIGEDYPHTGDDYDAPLGTPVYSPYVGTVGAKNDNSPTGGKLIIITSQDRYSWFMHLSSINPALTWNSPVSVGTWLGNIGSTGKSTGPHLHFEQHSRAGPMTVPSGIRKGKAPKETLIQPCTF
jgi:murein DD-endopeptidase MepM/ murein hydrolase activator NlpD